MVCHKAAQNSSDFILFVYLTAHYDAMLHAARNAPVSTVARAHKAACLTASN